jgi:hypothetical protein
MPRTKNFNQVALPNYLVSLFLLSIRIGTQHTPMEHCIYDIARIMMRTQIGRQNMHNITNSARQNIIALKTTIEKGSQTRNIDM